MNEINKEDLKLVDGLACRKVEQYMYILDYPEGTFKISNKETTDAKDTGMRERILINLKAKYAFWTKYNEGEDIGKDGFQRIGYNEVMGKIRNYRKNMTAYKEG